MPRLESSRRVLTLGGLEVAAAKCSGSSSSSEDKEGSFLRAVSSSVLGARYLLWI